MAFYSELTLNITTPPKLVTSWQQPSPLRSLPVWFVGEVRQIKVLFVRDAQAGAGAVEIVSAIGTSLHVFFGDPGNPVSSAIADPAVNDIYTVLLPLNIPAVATFLGTLASRNTKIEFELVSGTSTVKYQADIQLCCPVGTSGLVDPAPPGIALDTVTANAIYVAQIGLPGGSIILTSEDGLVQIRIYAGNDGEVHMDNVTP